MEHAYFKLLHLLSGHAAWTLTVVVLAAFFESIAFIGTFIPGSTAMFIAGALVGTGSLNLVWVFACAIAGAIAGDAASYWFGRSHNATIVQVWPFRSHPGLLTAGQKYFTLHGAKSVVFARFIAPLRAVVPVVAGMLGMTPKRFLAVNIVSALLWAPAHILPGVVFGASIELAGAVSFRLVVVVAILVALGWSTFKLTRIVVSHARAWTNTSRVRLLRWAHASDHATGRIVLRVLNPDNPATGLITVISLLLLVSGMVFFFTLEHVVRGDPLVQVDMSVWRFLQSFRSSWGDAVLSVLASLGSVPTLAALVVLGVTWMGFERRWRTVAYWLFAVTFSQLLTVAMQITQRPPPDTLTFGARSFPGNHIVATVVVYGFLAFLLARRVGTLSRVLVATTTIAIVIAVAFSGLYFGRFSFSDAVGGTALAAAWVFLVALTAVWRNPAKPSPRAYMPVVVLFVICASVAAQPGTNRPGTNQQTKPLAIVVTPAEWVDSVWKTFSCYRSTMAGDPREPIIVQWAATPAQIKAQLLGRGWIEGTYLSARSVLSLVSPDAAATTLPVLPKLDNGEPSTLAFTRSAASAEQRDVLRFWPTRYAVARRDGVAPTPIWLGSIVHEHLRRPSWPFNVLRPDRRADPMILQDGEASPWHDLELAQSTGCEGVQVTLIESLPE